MDRSNEIRSAVCRQSVVGGLDIRAGARLCRVALSVAEDDRTPCDMGREERSCLGQSAGVPFDRSVHRGEVGLFAYLVAVCMQDLSIEQQLS